MGWLVTQERFFKPGWHRLVFLLVAAFAFALTEFGRFVYRPYIRRGGIDDFGLADSIGNLGGIVVQIFFTIAVVNATRVQSYRLAVFLSAGYIAYEFLQPVLPKGVFDWLDVYGTLAGLACSVLLLWMLWRAFSDGSERVTDE
jgi:uncharacterized membrane protein